MPLKKNKRLIEQIRNGNRDAFEIFYWSYRQPVYNLALKYLKSQELAEDAVQDVFLKIWSSRENLNDDKSLRGLLFSSLKNHVLNMIKTNKRRIIRQFDYIEHTVHLNSGPDEDVQHAELQQILKEGIQQLPIGKQTVFRLKRIEGYSNREIANRLDISVNTVKSQFQRANDFITSYVKSNL